MFMFFFIFFCSFWSMISLSPRFTHLMMSSTVHFVCCFYVSTLTPTSSLFDLASLPRTLFTHSTSCPLQQIICWFQILPLSLINFFLFSFNPLINRFGDDWSNMLLTINGSPTYWSLFSWSLSSKAGKSQIFVQVELKENWKSLFHDPL